MNQSVYQKIVALAESPEQIEKTVNYVTQNMSRFLKKKEKVLICFSQEENGAGKIIEQAILNCGCTPIWLGEDRRWMSILKLAFTTKANCIVASPLLLLGLSKLAKHMSTPLFARNVVMIGYPTTDWLVVGVRRGLDCMAWGCFDPFGGAVIAGFTCQQVDGVHIRGEEYEIEIVDEDGQMLPMGEKGRVILVPKAAPMHRLAVGDYACISAEPCPCGCTAPKLVNIDTIKDEVLELSKLGESLHYWSSVLDCRIEKTDCGLLLELVVFQGEKLPKLPTAAKLVIRPFDPETDEPFDHLEVVKNRFLSENSH